MAKRLQVGTFTKFAMSHHFAGTWRLPEAGGNRGYADIDTWVELAKLSEATKIDFLMWADDLGSAGFFDRDLETPIREGIYGTMDPAILAAALSRETSQLGFVVTSAMIQDHPFHFARRMSTLDHLTRGRIGWNIVTSASPAMWRNFGLPNLKHDERYDWADEYMDVVYKLWEHSWEAEAPVHSIERNVWADPSKVHPINHRSARYTVAGPHMVEPSPQRTPVLFQAGASAQGTIFAGKHAEFQFIGDGSNPAEAGRYTRRVREAAEAQGRSADSIAFAPAMSFAVGETDADARRKHQSYVDTLSFTGAAAKLNTHIGIDLSKIGETVALDELKTEGIQGSLDSLKRSFPNGYNPTLKEIVYTRETGKVLVGTPSRVVDHLEELQHHGINGLLVLCITRPGSLQDFATYIAPELKRRGMMQEEYGPGTLRQKLFGGGDQLPADHPAKTLGLAASPPAAAAE